MGSSTILFALLEHRVRKMSRMEGRGAPMIFATVCKLERIECVGDAGFDVVHD